MSCLQYKYNVEALSDFWYARTQIIFVFIFLTK